MCYICVPTLKLIQAARTKEISTSRNRWIALEEGPTSIARLRLERKKERKPTRFHSVVVGTKEFLLTGITWKDVVRTIATRINFKRNWLQR